MSAAKVSVIVPVFNAASTVEKCINSILNQTWQNLEVLAVDDGSTDQSLAILQKIAQNDPRLKVIHQANKGVSSARNMAFAQTEGEYLQFADSDDILLPDATEKMVQAMEQQNADMVIAAYLEVVDNVQVRRGFLKKDEALTQVQFLDRLSIHPNSFYYAVLWNKLYRRSMIMDNGILCDGRLPWGEDFAFNTIYYRYAQRVAVLADPVYCYIRNPRGLALSTARQCLLHPFSSIKVKYLLQQYYNRLYRATGLYEAYRRVLPQYMFKITISG